MSKYAIGVDYGTLSGRAVLVDVKTGEELASSVYDYPHAVMDKNLPDGTPLGHDWALQDPQDYIDVLKHTIPQVLQESGISNEDVIGIGTDFTACCAFIVAAVVYFAVTNLISGESRAYLLETHGADTAMLITELGLMGLVVYYGFRYKKYYVALLSVAQTGLITWLELSGKKVPEANHIVSDKLTIMRPF